MELLDAGGGGLERRQNSTSAGGAGFCSDGPELRFGRAHVTASPRSETQQNRELWGLEFNMASQADYKDRQFLAVIGDEVSRWPAMVTMGATDS